MPFHKNSKLLFPQWNGFTLIELLIVIAILGILAAAVLISVNPNKRQNQARDAAIKNDIGQISTALQSYFTSGTAGTYPSSLSSLTTSSDLKIIPTPPAPNFGTYTYVPAAASGGGACDGVSTFCTYARVSYPLYDSQTTGDVWCWQSSTGKGQEMSVVSCTP